MFVTHAGAGASGGGGRSARGMSRSTPASSGSSATRHGFVHAGGTRVGVKKMSSTPPASAVPAGHAAESATPFVSDAMPVKASPVSAAGERDGAPAALRVPAVPPER